MPIRMGQIVGIGVVLIVLGFLVIFLGTLFGSKSADTKSKVAVGGFIGPIPFGFGNDRNLVIFATIISVIFMLIFFIFRFRN